MKFGHNSSGIILTGNMLYTNYYYFIIIIIIIIIYLTAIGF
jgi:hypothetical protein